MKHRMCSIIMVVVLFFSSLGLEACGANSVNNSYITQGEWIALINDAFGMYSYIEEEPYYTNIKVGHPFYEQVQIAREWDVIDGSVTEFDTNAYVTYAFAAVTLINATGFVGSDVTAGKKVSMAQDWGFIITEDKDYDIKDNISYSDAVVSLYYAKNQWANLSYDEVIEEVTFAENVINYIEEDFTEYEIVDGETYIPAYAYTEMEVGDVYVLPANKDNLVASAFVVTGVRQEGDYYVIENSFEEENILEHIEELNVQETYTPDLLACDFYDGNGNLVYSGSEYAYEQRIASKEGATGSSLLAKTDQGQFIQTKTKKEIALDFTIPLKDDKKVKVKGSFDGDGLSVGLEYVFWVDKSATGLGGNKDNRERNASIFLDASLKNIEVTDKIDMSWGKVKSAKVAVDYESSVEVGVKASSEVTQRRYAPYNNGNGSFMTNLKKALKSDGVPGYAQGAESVTGDIKIGSFDLASIGIAKVKLTIYLYTEVSGKLSVKLTCNATKGVEYKKGNLRFINTDNQTTTANLNASVEGGLKAELSAEVFGISVIGLELKIGLGLELDLVVNFVDNENHLIETGEIGNIDVEIMRVLQQEGAEISVEDMKQIAEKQGGDYVTEMIVTEKIPLKVDYCFEVKLYFVASIGLSGKSAVGKLAKNFNLKLEAEYKRDLLGVHVDDFFDLSLTGLLAGKQEKECKKLFTPFTKIEEQLESETVEEIETSTYEFETGQYLGVSQYSISLEQGETGHIKVTTLPNGYELTDVVYEVGDSKIARVSEDGTVLGLNYGVTYIRVYIPKTQFEMRCAVIVESDEVVPFSQLEDS